MSASDTGFRLLRFGVFELDTHAGELRKRGVRLRLQGQPIQVLATLLNHAGDLVTREQLRNQIWQADTFVDFDHSLHNAIARLRESLGDSAESPRYIETLPRRGYRFIAPVDRVSGKLGSHPFQRSRESGGGKIHSLAVLPLADLSQECGEEYFADGMTEALIASLAKIHSLRVISRTSAMQYKGVRKSLPEIARELNVDAVIEGSVLRSGERVRITAQLIHAASDQHLWVESYERDFADILALQSEIAREVATQVKIILTPEEQKQLGSVQRIAPRAHELYLKARYHWSKRTEEGITKALNSFGEAIEIEPNYADAHAGLADAYNVFGYYNAIAPWEAYPKGKAAALRALEVCPDLADGHAALGVVKRDYEWDWSGADKEFQRAIALNPACVQAYHWRGTLLTMLGRPEEGLKEKNKALAIDPLSVVVRTDVGRMLYFARQYEQALEHFRAALELDPNFILAHICLAHVYEQVGQFDKAIAELQTAVKISGCLFALSRLGHGYAVAGLQEQAHEVLHQQKVRSKERYVSPYDVAMIHVGLGEFDEAFRHFHEAVNHRTLWLGYMQLEPGLDSLRGDSRFDELCQAIKLPTMRVMHPRQG